MAEGQGCNVCNPEHDGNFYRFCKALVMTKLQGRLLDEITL
ncbi:MAG: hypothetical protein ACR2LL_12190 [Nitrosopumilus sp.]|nr:hypothetical protein [Nitrosopumilus sp.]